MARIPLFLLAWLMFAGTGQAQLISWKKTIVDKNFRSEGAAVADVNQDGKPDIIVGDFWYEAPSWKQHVLRVDRKPYNPTGYSDAFAVFSDDLNKDGFPDTIVVGFPGKPCYWYENPGKSGGKWKEHMIQDNACNETPVYVDLLGTGRRGLILGHKGEMCFFSPGKESTQPWEKLSVSGPGKNLPGTHHFAHGNGAGDINGDGKLDVIVAGGWWEQPSSNPTAGPWKFHPVSLPNCADIYGFDVDADGKNDIVCSSAHNTGFWWFQQKPGKDHPAFVKNDFFPVPATLAKEPAGIKFNKEEGELYKSVSKARSDQKRVPLRASAELSKLARAAASAGKLSTDGYRGKVVLAEEIKKANVPADLIKSLLEKHKIGPGHEVGVGYANGTHVLLIGDRGNFALPGQTHALHFVDINGDGLKDLVTGRRWWAHGPNGDDHPGDPAYLYWFQAVKGKDGVTTFIPHEIDDDSGIGTQFAIADINGDGRPDIVISNKKGVFVFEQAALSKE